MSLGTTKAANQPNKPTGAPPKNMVWIPGGTFLMGSDDHYPEEAPAHWVTVDGFWMDVHPVTNLQFTRFVKATGYVTLAERTLNAADYTGIDPDLLQPGSLVFQKPRHSVVLRNYHHWWSYIRGANWRHPEGPGSTLQERARHPVVHIAYEDAEAYAVWAGKVLPTEAEWEFAARGGRNNAVYPWGNEFMPNGRVMANTWQGEFPVENLLADGYERTSPIGTFVANGYGLFDMIGNVWEWTADWYQHYGADADACCAQVNPRGGEQAQSYDPWTPQNRIPRKVLKGGSYLCAPNYCQRYRPAARIAQHIDTGTCHQGFRCIMRV